jgi:hypothetical protein
MLRNKNNALLITSVQGERGEAGFPGEQGIACYTGTGDPNTLTFTLPTYNDPGDYIRPVETIYYQDTDTGEVWTAKTRDGVYFGSVVLGSLSTADNWTKTSTVLKGSRGDQGPAGYAKVEINLGTNNTGYNRWTVVPGTPLSETEAARVIFPGTDTGSFTSVKVIVDQGGYLDLNSTLYLKDSSDTEIASKTILGKGKRIEELTITGTFPAGEEDIYLSVESSVASGNRGSGVLYVYYLLIT